MHDRPKEESQFRAYLELLRIPNVFTAIADVMMGYLVVQGTFEPYGPLIILIATSSCLYLAGMVFNDLFDREIDAVERPERPIPSGRVSVSAAQMIGIMLLSAGLAMSLQLSWRLMNFVPFGVACGIAVLALLYNKWLKQTLLGPLALGGCRFLNVFLGMSLMLDPPSGMHWMIAGGVGVYIAGVTLFAQGEAGISSRSRLVIATALMFAGIALVALSPRFVSENQEWRLAGMPPAWPYFWVVLVLHILWRNSQAILVPSPAHVQTAVKNGIMSLIVIDAAASVPMASLGMLSPMFILILIIPATMLGRWIYST